MKNVYVVSIFNPALCSYEVELVFANERAARKFAGKYANVRVETIIFIEEEPND